MRSAEDSREQRGNFLAVLFPILIASFVLFFMFLICGGFSLYMLAVVGGLGLLAGFHYFFWGHALSKEVATKRDETASQESAENSDWTEEERDWYRRF
jgi:hypothetical protein